MENPEIYLDKNNIKGKLNVYKDEYAVVILVNNLRLINKIKLYNSIAYPNKKDRPNITPHISIVQGVYREESLNKLKNEIDKISKRTKSKEITMSNKVSKVGNNIFMDVYKGNDFFNNINKVLTYSVDTDGPMKQIIDEVEKGNIEISEIDAGKSWRNFNIPGNNRPHITVVYGKNNLSLVEKINKNINNQNFRFYANNISIFMIDESGNLYGNPIYSVNLLS